MLLKIARFYSQKFCTISKFTRKNMSGAKLNEVLSTLEKFAPKALSESWDNTGLLVEPYTPRYVTCKISVSNNNMQL